MSNAVAAKPLYAKAARAAKIRAALMVRGIEVRSLAKTLGVTGPMVSQVISGSRRTRYIRELIARTIGEDYETLWGER